MYHLSIFHIIRRLSRRQSVICFYLTALFLKIAAAPNTIAIPIRAIHIPGSAVSPVCGALFSILLLELASSSAMTYGENPFTLSDLPIFHCCLIRFITSVVRVMQNDHVSAIILCTDPESELCLSLESSCQCNIIYPKDHFALHRIRSYICCVLIRIRFNSLYI